MDETWMVAELRCAYEGEVMSMEVYILGCGDAHDGEEVYT